MREGASDEVKKALDSGVAADLVEHAKNKNLSAPELAKEARRRAAKIDAEAAQEAFDATWRRRSVSFGRSAGGGRSGRWQLDEVGGVLVETALDTVAGPLAADSRSREQRHADALVMLASRALQVGADLNGAQVRPHVALVIDEESWVASRTHLEAVDETTAAKVDETHGSGAAFGLRADGSQADVEGWQWLESTPALVILAVLLLTEVVADKVPVVDSANDALQTLVRPAAGGVVFAAGSASETAAVTDPGTLAQDWRWVPVLLGVLLALAIHLTKRPPGPGEHGDGRYGRRSLRRRGRLLGGPRPGLGPAAGVVALVAVVVLALLGLAARTGPTTSQE
ncbi:DUF4126 family protein [Georgenia sp. SUBG003]|uniref:DUF4126 family protein n=1 Tax=Georgenia sp. SUBG003 TaxID=1497974 RepID=UPI003AB3CA55